MDRGAWWAAVHGIAKSQTGLSDFTFTFHFQALEKEMATHSSVLAWRIPGMGKPGGLMSMGSLRVGQDWSDLAAAAAAAVFSNTGESYRLGSWLSLLHLLSLRAFFSLFIYLFLVCFVAVRAFSSHSKPRLLFVEVWRLLSVVASLVAEHRL